MTQKEIMERLTEGSRQFALIEKQMSEVLAALKLLPDMQADIARAKADSATVKEILEAWNAVKTGGRFIRWLVPIIGGLGAAWATLKSGFWSILK